MPVNFRHALLFALCCGFPAASAMANGSWCPPDSAEYSNKNPECVFDIPKREVQARRAAWYAQSRDIAAKLPVPYEDLVVAYLSANNRGTMHRYCLRLFDEKPGDALTKRLKAVNESPRFCYGPAVNDIYIYRITLESPNTFKVSGGSYCGPLCASAGFAIITRNEDGTLTVGKSELLWIS